MADEMKQLRVLVLFGNIPLYGQERGNIEVFARLKPLGVDALFVTHERWGHLKIQPELDRRGLAWTTATYIDRIGRGMTLGAWVRSLWRIGVASCQLWRLVRSYRPTHIHVANPLHFLNFLPLLALTRVPIVYRLGDKPSAHNMPYKLLWMIITLRVSHFVCISRFVQDTLSGTSSSSTNSTVIYNHPPDRSSVNSLGPNTSFAGVTFIYCGQLSPEKGVDLFVAAAIDMLGTCERVRFFVLGDYEWRNPFALALIQRVKAHGCEGRITFTGFVENVNEFMSVSDVHVCPSICEEALGNTVMEAKAAALPSIVFPSGGLPELITHGCDGFVCSSKTKAALVQGMMYYLLHPERIKTHGEAARRSLHEQLGVDSFARRWRAVYDSVG